MSLPEQIAAILANYDSDNPGTRTNLARILMHGRLGGTGRLLILPVDQGFEHGPARSFAANPPAYDPHYHFRMAVNAGLSAFAAPLGLLEAGAARFAGQVPLILKVNSANSLSTDKRAATQAVTAGVADALRLGCVAIGFTIYPGSERAYEMMEDLRDLAAEAREAGLAVVVWSYPRGGDISKEGETAADVVGYGAHMAALLGAHLIKVKLPTTHLEQPEARKAFTGIDTDNGIAVDTMAARVREVVRSCFAGRRLVVFSGGERSTVEGLCENARAIMAGGGNGSIIGRNTFQRPYEEAMKMLDALVAIYLGKS